MAKCYKGYMVNNNNTTVQEVIAHLNSGNRGADSTDPVAQIAKVTS